MKNHENDNKHLSKEQLISNLNKENYSNIGYANYEKGGRDHRFSDENIDAIQNIIQMIYKNTQGKKCLDVGTGSGLVLLQELKIFPECIGLDLSIKMALSRGISKDILVEGSCYQMPFDNEEYDLVSAYCMLHHLANIHLFFTEAFRVLKHGGYLYTDADKNIYCVKLERRLRMIQYSLLGRKNDDMYKFHRDRLNYCDRDEYHEMGLDFLELERMLKKIGFSKVIITPMFSINPLQTKKLSFRIMKLIYRLFKLKSCFTHIRLIAIK